MKLSIIAHHLSHSLKPEVKDVDIQWLLTDSRTLTFPAESLFIAIRTTRNDGHNYIAQLYQQNVKCFIVSQLLPEYQQMTDAVFIQVPDTLKALQHLGAVHRSNFNIPVIGITGSNGKTIVKEWLYQLLHTDYRIVRSPRSYNSQLGVPLSVWGLHENADMGIFEAGISQRHEMELLEPIIRPTIGIFTHLGEAHQENFSGLKQKCDEKLTLFEHAETLIYCADNKIVQIAIEQSAFKGKLFWWGKSDNVILQIIDTVKLEASTRITWKYKSIQHQTIIPFTNDSSIENSIHCLATLLHIGIEIETINERMILLEAVAMRMEVKEGQRNCVIINDTYNSDIQSLSIALDFLQQEANSKSLTRTVILSDILQSGMSSDVLYQQVAYLLHSKSIHRLIGIGQELMPHSSLFDCPIKSFFPTTDDFLKSPLIKELRNEIILLKGSRNFHFESISEQLELITHETILEVNLNALVDNLNYFRSKLHRETQVMCMVKAFAYGSGAVEVASTLQHHHCDYLAVAVADEGAQLRKDGIHIPIVVMNPELGSLGILFDYQLEPEIYNFRILKAFTTAAEKLGLRDYPIHIKIDSGMHRLGFEANEVAEVLDFLHHHNQVKVRSVFSHLSGADEEKFDTFTQHQVSVFTDCANQFSTAFPHTILRHILNSAGTERFPHYQMDMVRLGIGLYGISSIEGQQLQSVSTLKTTILQIKHVKAGETIGYGRKGQANKDLRIAILPIGYADGYNRKLSNGIGEVLVNGKRAKVIGSVCMDLTMIDITHIQAQEGDSVEVFGGTIRIEEVAHWLHTIPYEVLTSISRRVKRIYFKE